MLTKQVRRRSEKRGRWAEALAEIYLRCKGYRILERRYKTKLGEIDLITQKGDILIAVEVKYRPTFQEAHDSLTRQAERRISNAIDIYLSRSSKAYGLGIRFDAIFITGRRVWNWRVHHIMDAWRDNEFR